MSQNRPFPLFPTLDRLLLVAALSVLVCTVSLAFMGWIGTRTLLREERNRQIMSLAFQLRAELADPVVRGDVEAVRKVANSFLARPEVAYLGVYDLSGTLIASSTLYREQADVLRASAGWPPPPGPGVRIRDVRVPWGDRDLPVTDACLSIYGTPVSFRWGIIQLGLSHEEDFLSTGRFSILLFLVAAALSGFTYLLLSRQVGRLRAPLATLIEGSARIEEGDLSYRFGLSRADEFGEAGGALDRTVAHLAALKSRLEDLNRNLEQSIEDRTQALQEARNLLETVLNALPDGTITINEMGFLTSANRSFFSLTGFERRDIGAPFMRLFAECGLQKSTMLRCFLKALRGQAMHLEQTMRFSGRECFMELDITPLQPGPNRPREILVLARDLTLQREVEDRLANFQKMEGLTELAGGVAHDFSNVLATMVPAMEILRQRLGDDAELSRRFEILEHTVHKAGELTGRLMSFARHQGCQMQTLSFPQVVMQALSGFRSGLPSGLRLDERLSAEPCELRGDPILLEQMVRGLLENAVESMPRGGTLTVLTRQFSAQSSFAEAHPEVPSGTYAELVIRDTGEGTDPHLPFRNSDPFASPGSFLQPGGLRLASVYGIVKRHGGYFHCASEKRRGTEFHILLPLSWETPETISAPASTMRESGCILVVDDERLVREVAQDLLTEIGYNVETCEDGASALARLQNGRPPVDLILLDMVMPGMDGLTTLRSIREIAPDLEVIVVSGFETDAKLQQALALGHVRFLSKPYRVDRLATLVQEILAPPSPLVVTPSTPGEPGF